jgi:hypothetical protein
MSYTEEMEVEVKYWCLARGPEGAKCTRPWGHDGQHIADYISEVSRWDPAPLFEVTELRALAARFDEAASQHYRASRHPAPETVEEGEAEGAGVAYESAAATCRGLADALEERARARGNPLG